VCDHDRAKARAGAVRLAGSAFFFLFSISAIAVGFLVNRVATRWVLLVLAVIWALTQFPMLGTVSFSTLLICRVILGAGEGPAGAVAVHAEEANASTRRLKPVAHDSAWRQESRHRADKSRVRAELGDAVIPSGIHEACGCVDRCGLRWPGSPRSPLYNAQ